MGQARFNPNHQLAREGKLPPKDTEASRREAERRAYILECIALDALADRDIPYATSGQFCYFFEGGQA
jgi:hypothetical protein